MSESFPFIQVGYKVFSILTDNPKARDDDNILLYEIWSKESKATGIDEFFKELLDGKLSFFETIRRSRQKIQEKHESLRGEEYEARHKMQAHVCNQLTFFDLW